MLDWKEGKKLRVKYKAKGEENEGLEVGLVLVIYSIVKERYAAK